MSLYVLGVLPIALMLMGFPIFIVLLTASASAIVFFMDIPIAIIHQTMFGSLDKEALLAIPFFIFAGDIMVMGGMARRILGWVRITTGNLKGGLGITAIGACTIFGAISGSSAATVATIGKLLYQPLLDAGYGQRYTGGILTSSGAIAIVVPPSIAFILYGVIAEQPIDLLFIAGVVPGLIMAILMALYNYYFAFRKKIIEGEAFTFKKFLKSTVDAGFALGMPILILGGIYLGVFSPTESAGAACLYAIIVTMFIYKELSIKQLWEAAVSSCYLTAQVMIIVAASGVFSWLLTVQGVPQQLCGYFSDANLPVWALLIMVNIFLLIVGCLLDTASAILVLTPILVPLMINAGVDLIHFGVIITVNLAIGMFTPPFGLNIFVAQAVFRTHIKVLYNGLLPFILVNIIALLLVTFIPELSLMLIRIIQ